MEVGARGRENNLGRNPPRSFPFFNHIILTVYIYITVSGTQLLHAGFTEYDGWDSQTERVAHAQRWRMLSGLGPR